MPDEKAKKAKLTPDQKERIVALASEGADNASIARQLGVGTTQVSGYLQTMQRIGKFSPPLLPQTENLMTTTPPNPESTAQQQTHSVPLTPPAGIPARDGGLTGGRPVLADPGGFTATGSDLRWTIERIVPPDGVLGTHFGPLTVEEIGNTYGEGTYKITKQEGNKPVAVEWVRKFSSSFGPSRNPQVAGPSHASPRPFSFRQADPGQPGAPASPFRRFDPHDFPRPSMAGGGGESVAAEAVRQMGQQNLKFMEQQDKARQAGPDASMVKFLEAQQGNWDRRWEEERHQAEERRRTEEDKWERRQKEDRDRWERDQKAAKDAHDREMARIKADNDSRLAEMRLQAEDREKRDQERQKFLMDLEDKRLAVIRQQAEADQKRLESELGKTREEMRALQDRTAAEIKDNREATTAAIAQQQAELAERLQRDREAMEREYKLRERSLDREHDLNKSILDLQREQFQQQAGDQLFQTINTIIREVSKGLEKVVDLKKLEAMTPEAQAAAARAAMDGNVQTGPEPKETVPPPQPKAAPKGSGNGKAPAAEAPESATDRVEALINEGLQDAEGRRLFNTIMNEWALHVDIGNTPAVFANLFLEMLRDEEHGNVRRFCSVFFTLVSAREWDQMLVFLKPHLDEQTHKIFCKPNAKDFYDAFKTMVSVQLTGYWEQLLRATKPETETAPAQEEPTVVLENPPAEVPVEPPGPSAPPKADDGVPVPPRGSLRPLP